MGDGSVVIEADTPASFVDGLVLNTSYTMGTEKWCSGKDNAESAQVGFEFTQDQFVFNHSMDFLGKNGDNDALTMDSDLGFTMDNFSFGASVSSFMPSVFGGDGGASAWTHMQLNADTKLVTLNLVQQLANQANPTT